MAIRVGPPELGIFCVISIFCGMVSGQTVEILHNSLNVEWLDVYRKRYTCSEVYKLVNRSGPPSLVNLF